MANLLSTTVNGQLNTGNVIDLGYTVNGSIATTAFRGINFHSFGDLNYYIGKPAGSWTQPLHIHFYTGIWLRSHQLYGGTRFYNLSSGNQLMAVGDGGDIIYTYGQLESAARLRVTYNTDRYQFNLYRPSGTHWWFTNDSDKLGLHQDSVGDKFYFGTGGDFWSSTNGWLSTALGAKQNASTAITTSNWSSYAAPRAYVTESYVEFTIGGDANTYYPVTIHNWNGSFSWQRYSIHRSYSDTAPWDPIGTGSHKGGLTFAFEWAGDIAWGGNDKSIRVIEFNETYTQMVAGLQLAHCEGVVVWLRGGEAYYRLHGPGGRSQSYTINMSTWTSCAGVQYEPRSYDGGRVNSEINSRYPIRGNGNSDIFVNNQAVIHSGNIGSQSVSNADTVDGYHMNQALLTTSGPTFANVYTSGWFRNYGVQGIYNESYGTHFYSYGGSNWGITGSGSNIYLAFRSNHESNIRGYVHANTDNNIGFLSEDGNWVLRTWNRGVEAYGSMRAPIFYDSNDTGYYLDPNSTSNLLTVNVLNTYVGNAIYFGGGNNYFNWDGARINSNVGIQSGSDMRAPIFYDSNDTTYYLDPNNTLLGLKIAGNIDMYARSASWAEGIRVRVPSTSTWGGIRFTRDRGNDDGNWAIGFTGIDSTDDLTFWGNTGGTGAMRMRLDQASNLITYGSMRAPVFYDSDNTGFYLDPANSGTSLNMNGRMVGNSWTTYGRNYNHEWIEFPNYTGLYSPNNNAHFRPNNANYGSWLVTGTRNGWRGIEFESGDNGNVNLMISNGSSVSGVHNNSYGWQFRWDAGTLYCHKNTYGGGTAAVVWDSANDGSGSGLDADLIDGIDSSRIVYGDGERKSSEGYSDMNRYNQASGFYFYNNPSNNPFGDWTNWINVMGNSWASNYGFQLAHQFHGDGFAIRRVTNGTFYSWRTIIDSGNILGQTVNYVTVNYNNDSNSTYQLLWGSGNSVYGTGDVYVNPFLDRVYAKSFETGAAGDANNSYRCRDTGGTSRNAMFVNSSNQLQFGNTNFSNNYFVGSVGVNVSPSATAGRIDASNDIVAYSSSDERLKYNITPIENAIDKVKSLTGVEFDWKPEYKHAHGYEGHDTGIIAQQVQEVIPSAVRTNDTGFLAVRYEKLIGLLIEANKELAARVEELEKKLG